VGGVSQNLVEIDKIDRKTRLHNYLNCAAYPPAGMWGVTAGVSVPTSTHNASTALPIQQVVRRAKHRAKTTIDTGCVSRSVNRVDALKLPLTTRPTRRRILLVVPHPSASPIIPLPVPCSSFPWYHYVQGSAPDLFLHIPPSGSSLER
jgi:hypothetical protein